MPLTTIGFEGLTPANVSSPTIPAGYDGLNWTNIGTKGIHYLNKHYNSDGFHNVIDQKIVGDAHGFSSGGPVMAEFDDAIAGAHATFSLKSGVFAAAFNTGEHVTFESFDGGTLIGVKTVIMDQTAHTITFGAKFAHITSIHIVSDGGTDANPNDGGTGSDVAMDDVIVRFDPMPSAVHDHDFAPVHDAVSHWSEWPLAMT